MFGISKATSNKPSVEPRLECEGWAVKLADRDFITLAFQRNL